MLYGKALACGFCRHRGPERSRHAGCRTGTSPGTSPESGSPAPFTTHQWKPNVYWIEGGGGNSGVIIGDKSVIVVDAKTTAAGGKELLDDIAKITPKPVTTVIETHSDGDHVNGLASFPAGIAIIAHENNKKEQDTAFAAGGRGAPPAGKLVGCSDACNRTNSRFGIRRLPASKLSWMGKRLVRFGTARLRNSSSLQATIPCRCGSAGAVPFSLRR